MKNWICIVLVACLSCGKPTELKEESTILPEENDNSVLYEGRVPLDEGNNLYIELTMVPSARLGEGSYEMKEFAETDSTRDHTFTFAGQYSTLYGETLEQIVIQFHNSASKGYDRTYLTRGSKGKITDSNLKIIRTEPFRTTDLTVRIFDKDKLIVLDDRLNTISRESEFNLIRRTSKLFTIEGYLRHRGDSADFFEMNTGEICAVSKYGDYRKVIRQYHQLANRKFEMTYLKGVGFSIRHINKEGREIEALVIKKVLQMTASPPAADG